jgi:MFS family permease
MGRVVEAIAPARLGRPFRWLLAMSSASNIGDGIALAVGPLLVASQTDEPFLVAFALVLQRLPWLLVGLFAGVLADRMDRRRLLVIVSLARAGVLVVLGATILVDHVDIAIVLVATFLLGVCETFTDTTATTLLPMVVEPDDLPIGNARLMGSVITLNQLVVPPIGAFLFTVGMVVPVIAEALFVVLSALCVLRLVLPDHGATPGDDDTNSVRAEIVDGLRWLWRHDAVRTLALTVVLFNVTFGAAWSVLVLYAKDHLDAGDVGYGLIATATAAGGILGTVGYGWLSARVSLGRLMRAGLIIETFTYLALLSTTRLWVALAITFVFGAHAFVWYTTSTSIRQRAVPHELQGRVGSVYFIGVQGGLVVGGLVGGAIAGQWGILGPFWFAFVGSAVLVAIMWRQFDHIGHDAA